MVADATWTSSDPAIVALSADDPPVVTAVKAGLSATATLTVVAGTSLPDGTTRWRVAPTATGYLDRPLYPHRVDETVPDLFAVETDELSGSVTLRALAADGTALWTEAAPAVPVMGDSAGAVVGEIPHPVTANPIGLARFGGPVSAMPWQYASLGEVGRPAQGPDGTIVAIEMVPGVQTNGCPIGDRAVLVLDGATRQVRARVPLPRSVVEFHAQWATHPVFGHPCTSDRWEAAPVTTVPIVAEDGSAYLQVVQTTRVEHGYCSQADISRADDHVVQLIRVTPAGVVTAADLYRFTGPYTPWWPETGQVLPDGLGGVVATWSRRQASSPPASSQWRRAPRCRRQRAADG